MTNGNKEDNMFRTGVISDEISQDLNVAIELSKKFHLDAIEIRSVSDKGPFEFSDEDISDIKKAVFGAGMKFSAISSPFFKCDLNNKDEISQNIKGLERCIKMADIFDTRLIRGFTFWKSGTLASCLEQIVERFQKPIEMLKQNGMIMALESDPSVNASTAFQLSEVIEAIDAPQVKALWDPGNNIYFPGAEIPYPDGYNRIKKHIVHVHLKDAVLDADGNAVGCRFGEGNVDFKGQLQRLIDDRYEGYAVMETHYRKARTLSKGALELPGGSNFSADGYEPTSESLESLMSMMQQLKL
jgi:L-ribulose-5-phosphate 3-epimerase